MKNKKINNKPPLIYYLFTEFFCFFICKIKFYKNYKRFYYK